MSEIVPFSINHSKAGKGYLYLFKYSDFETILTGITSKPVYLHVNFTQRVVNKSSKAQMRGEWFLGYCSIPSYLSPELPDKNAIGIDIRVSTVPHQEVIDAKNRQILKQVCLDQMRLFFEKALTLDISSMTIVWLMQLKTLDFQINLGLASKHLTISVEST